MRRKNHQYLSLITCKLRSRKGKFAEIDYVLQHVIYWAVYEQYTDCRLYKQTT